MKNPLIGLLALLIAVLALMGLVQLYEKAYIPSGEAGEMPELEINEDMLTVNTARIGSDDAVETAVAVSQIIYPVTEEENSPGAVVLVNRSNLAEVMAAASRVQHFPVNAPLLYVEENSIPELTRQELTRLQPEGVPMDFNTQVYLVGTISEGVEAEIRSMGYKTCAFRISDPVELVVTLDDWTSTMHGDHRNEVAIANLDNLEAAIPSMFWNAHRGDGLAFVTNDGVPQGTRDMLQRRADGPWIYLFGDSSIIPDRVARDLAQYGHVTRIPGADPTTVSTRFAAFHDVGKDWGAWVVQGSRTFGWDIGEAGHNAIFVNLNGPAGWQNAVVATTLSHMGKHAPVIILDGADNIPQSVRDYLDIIRPYPTAPQQQLLNHGWIIGGPETIGWETQVELDQMLEAYDFVGDEVGGTP
jgi:hypothetical protein